MMLRSLGRALFSVRTVAASLVAAIGLATAPLPAFAVGGTTGTINGVITDEKTSQPLAGVAVAATSPVANAKATTDAKGFYSFSGLPVDTYTISFQLAGFEAQSFTGITVQGDQTVTVGGRLAKTLTTIGRVTSRSASSAFQPKQTTDTYQISGRQLTTALGKSFGISQSQLQSSVPGLQQTVYGSSSIRGSTRTEIAYQYEGVNYTEPLTNQFSNSLGLNGIQSLQVNPGAGDASQGNAGAGAVNLVSKRGSRPAFGSIDLETLNFPYSHQAGFEYGFATPNGRMSNYTAYLGQNANRTYGLNGQPAVLQDKFFSTDSSVTRDIVNNFVLKTGKNSQNSLQLFYQTRYSDFQVNHGGIKGLTYKTGDANIAAQNSTQASFFNIGKTATLTSSQAAALRLADFQSEVGLLPGQTSVNQALVDKGFQHQPVDFIKLEYDQNPDGKTFWANRLYRIVSVSTFLRPYFSTSAQVSSINRGQGGYRTGLAGDLSRQFDEHNLVTLSYVYESLQPVYDQQSNLTAYRSLSPALNTTTGGYELPDFLPAGSACPKADPLGTTLANAGAGNGGCGYLTKYAGNFGGTTPRIPNVNFVNGGTSQQYGFGLRDQLTVNPQLKLDLGVRVDGSSYHLLNKGNTSFTFGNDVLKPLVVQPRLAFAFQLDKNDAVRASYGRSVEFAPNGIINTPISVPSAFYNVPSYDSRTGAPAKYCGPLNKTVCTSYGQQLHDQYVAFTSPEAFAVKPATYNNYDFSYSHQFANNVGVKITPFYKRGYDVNIFGTTVLGTDPVTNLPQFGPTVLTNLGIDKSTGVEFLLTKDAAYGLSGFLDLTYVNRLQNIPPGYLGQTEDFYPSAPPQSLQLGSLFRAGYLSPLTGRLGLTYKSRNGLRINPIVSYDKGFPIGAGTLTSAYVNGVATVVPNVNISIPGFGPVSNSGSASGVSQYVDPTNPGTVSNPKLAATRGTPETSLTGGILSKARFNTDLVLEYAPPGTHNTFGVYVSNLFNQIYAEPNLNPRYQPVATGVAGPNTGQVSTVGSLGAGPAGALGFANYGNERFGYNAYNFTPSLTTLPISFRFYYQLGI